MHIICWAAIYSVISVESIELLKPHINFIIASSRHVPSLYPSSIYWRTGKEIHFCVSMNNSLCLAVPSRRACPPCLEQLSCRAFLWHSGGQLEFRKRFLYMLHWAFDTTGMPHPAALGLWHCWDATSGICPAVTGFWGLCLFQQQRRWFPHALKFAWTRLSAPSYIQFSYLLCGAHGTFFIALPKSLVNQECTAIPALCSRHFWSWQREGPSVSCTCIRLLQASLSSQVPCTP